MRSHLNSLYVYYKGIILYFDCSVNNMQPIIGLFIYINLYLNIFYVVFFQKAYCSTKKSVVIDKVRLQRTAFFICFFNLSSYYSYVLNLFFLINASKKWNLIDSNLVSPCTDKLWWRNCPHKNLQLRYCHFPIKKCLSKH